MLPQMEGTAGLVQEPGYNLTMHVLQSKNVSAPEGYSSAVWLVLFFIVISLSIVVNTVYVASLLCKRNLTGIHFILGFFFLVNIADYGLLIFEFYLDPASQFPYSEGSCAIYQFFLQGCTVLRSCTLVLLVYQAYISSFNPAQSSGLNNTVLIFFLLLIIQVLLAIPSLLYSKLIVYPDSTQYCVMDLSSLPALTGSEAGKEHAANAFFFLIYKSVLAYWLPLILVLYPIIRMAKMVNTLADNQFTITITIAVTISFLVFHFPLAATVLARELVTILNIPVSSSTTWIINVFHSLSLLISFFFHVFRPLVCLVLDQDSLPNLCRRSYRQVEKDEEENDKV